MSVIRVCALQSLADVITEAVPALEDRVCIGNPDDGHEQTYPYMVITAGKWAYQPFEMAEEAAIDATTHVFNVGEHEAPVQIRIGADSAMQRDDLADAVVAVFLAAMDDYGFAKPGILVTEVSDCLAIPFRAAWELEDDELIHLPAFDRSFEAVIQLTGIVPALVTRLNVYTIDELHLGLADMDVSVDADTFEPPHVEVVSILEDGTIEPV